MQPQHKNSGRTASPPTSASAAETPPRPKPPAKPLDVYAFVPSTVYTRKQQKRPPLTEEDILCWADLHFERTGKWPKEKDGTVEDAPGERNTLVRC